MTASISRQRHAGDARSDGNFARTDRLSLADQSYETIRTALLAGELPVSERLSINRLSRQLGIGRSPVRDAINRLATERLLLSQAKSGIVIRSVTLAELHDIAGLREALEPYAAALAANRLDAPKRRRLQSLCREFARLARRIRDANFQDDAANRAMQQADWAFHAMILDAAGNRMLKKWVEDHHLLLRKVRYPSVRTVRHLSLTLLEHWRIFRALAASDADGARAAMLRHARRGGEAMLQSWHDVNDSNPPHGGVTTIREIVRMG